MESFVESRLIVSTPCRGRPPPLGDPTVGTRVNCISGSIESLKSIEYCSIGLICLLMRIIMSVGYKPYVESVFSVREIVKKETCEVLTETQTMAMKPGSLTNTPNVAIQYKILKSCSEPFGEDASRSWTYPCSNK